MIVIKVIPNFLLLIFSCHHLLEDCVSDQYFQDFSIKMQQAVKG